PDMGYSYGQAYIVNSSAGWVVIFGNGYQSETAKASLYVLRASDGALLKKIETGVGSPGENCNGLSSPTLIDPDNDGLVDYGYAGDLQGNLWKFDFTDGDVNNWKIAFKDDSNIPQPLFTARNKNGEVQPITHKPDIIRHCDKNKHGYMLIFGTGRYLGQEDLRNTRVQTIYGIWDWSDQWRLTGNTLEEINTEDKYLGTFGAPVNGKRSLGNVADLDYLEGPVRNATLLEQTQVHTDDVDARVLSNNRIKYYTPPQNDLDDVQYHMGWYFDLPESKERVVKNFAIRDNVVVAVTTIPSIDVCAVGGESYLMEMNACNGGRTRMPAFDYNRDKVVNEADSVLVDSQAQPGYRYHVAPSGIKYQELLNAPVIISMDQNIRERKYFSSSIGNIITLDESPEQAGVYSWKQLE
ncbi:MAG: hypothetical protein MI747_14140, partial [Desulfobacterales bacterium]|nr:hypothetical protein [Desulfobacterales bacterium]